MRKLYKTNSYYKFKPYIVFLLIFHLVLPSLIGQVRTDTSLIFNKPATPIHPIERKVTFGITSNSAWYEKYNPIIYLASSFMYVYQKVVSPQLSATCGYNPSCSEMSKHLLQHYGLFKGIFYTADRLTRCNKVSFTDYLINEISPDDGKIHEDIERYE